MSSRTRVSCRTPARALGVLTCALAALILPAPAAVAGEAGCSGVGSELVSQETEARRRESNLNPATGKPYSTGLPDCRAYEMVSPLYKQSRDAEVVGSSGLLVAPQGDAAGFHSQGAFAEPENELQGAQNENNYLARRGSLG